MRRILKTLLPHSLLVIFFSKVVYKESYVNAGNMYETTDDDKNESVVAVATTM